MQKVDANVVLRYVLDDHESSVQAREIIEQHIVEVPIEVLCEVVYVLNGFYRVDRQSIGLELQQFFAQTQCVLPHREAVLKGLEYYAQSSNDFVDCLLAGYADAEKDDIYTFDDKLQRLIARIKTGQQGTH
jgi:predicted nucleic-acid-binding protein